MEIIRFILLVSLGLVGMMLWQAWQEDYGVNTLVTTSENTLQQDSDIVTIPKPDSKAVPNIASDKPALTEAISEQNNSNINTKNIHVSTDVYDIEISTTGGNIIALTLKKYLVDKKNPNEFVQLLSRDARDFFIVQGGLLGEPNQVISHKQAYNYEQDIYEMGDKNTLIVPLTWRSAEGVLITKAYEFERDSYVIKQRYTIDNQSPDNWTGRVYTQVNRGEPKDTGSVLIHTYTGGVLSSEDNHYEKIDFDDISDANIKRDVNGGWMSMIQHYFLAAFLPGDETANYHYYSLYPGTNQHVLGVASPTKTVAPGASILFEDKLFIGPKLQRILGDFAPNLELTVDYGWFWFIAKPLFWLLDRIYQFVQNWGWSIIILTILIKLVFYKLSAAGYRSMAKMRQVQPRMLSLRDRYKDDKTRLNQAMMELYKTEKINPLGGCFPILIQIPVFIALYWVLLESVELRQASFILWLDNLSVPDPYFVLPLIMGVTMFLQQKLNPAPMDPMQQKVMNILPVVFTVFFAFFPAGLVLYWVANNVLSILQQMVITRSIEKAGSK